MLRAVVATAALLVAAGTAQAGTVLSAASDAAWGSLTASGQTQFVKQGAASVRRGNAGAGGDWEYAVVGANDAPIGTPGQIAWGTGASFGLPATGAFVSYTGAGALTLGFNRNGADWNRSAQVGAGVDTLWIRARTAGATVASLQGLTLVYAGGTVNLGGLVGDGDGQYVGFADSRLTQGFQLKFTGASFSPAGAAGGSSTMLQVKVGSSPISAVPEPGTWALMIGGFGLVGGALRRRRRAAVA